MNKKTIINPIDREIIFGDLCDWDENNVIKELKNETNK